jgi:hypothetical protein
MLAFWGNIRIVAERARVPIIANALMIVRLLSASSFRSPNSNERLGAFPWVRDGSQLKEFMGD